MVNKPYVKGVRTLFGQLRENISRNVNKKRRPSREDIIGKRGVSVKTAEGIKRENERRMAQLKRKVVSNAEKRIMQLERFSPDQKAVMIEIANYVKNNPHALKIDIYTFGAGKYRNKDITRHTHSMLDPNGISKTAYIVTPRLTLTLYEFLVKQKIISEIRLKKPA